MRRLALLPLLPLVFLLAGVANAASPSAPPPGPPYPDPVHGQSVYDYAGVFPDGGRLAEQIVDNIESGTNADVVVYTQVVDRDAITLEDVEAHAAALMDQWGGSDDSMVMLVDVDTSAEHAQVQLYPSSGFERRLISDDQLEAIHKDDMLPLLQDGHVGTAVMVGLARIVMALESPRPLGGDPAAPGPAPGPPFPEPETDRAVYDFAGILSPAAIADAERVIDAIEERTGAEVVVYTQDSGGYPSTDETNAKARALMDQWGVGRKGFDDGLVIFFDMEPNLEHGQVQLFAGPGFEAALLSNQERQAIFENDMLPHLREADFDAALAVALAKVDVAATPEHAAELQRARQFNAVLGLVGAPIVFLGLSGWAFFHWRRFGKDPVYLDDASILMPAPPPDLTAASGAMIMDGSTSRRALTTAMLDLASRGLIAFREESSGLLGLGGKKVGIDVAPGTADAQVEAQRRLNARRPIGPAEEVALRKLQAIPSSGDHDFISPDDLPKFGSDVAAFDTALEKHVVDRQWFGEKPSKVVARWTGRGVLAIIAGVIGIVAGLNIPISGLTAIGAAAIAGGIVMLIVAQAMPAVSMSGAMIRAMLAAYKRTLQKTMAQARSMQQVVDEAGLTWLDTPDQAVVWGTALGLQGDIEGVLSRSLADVKAGTTATGAVPYFPAWYQTSNGTPFLSSSEAVGSGASLFSDSGIPDIGGMMSALGTIGNSPSSSGSSGGGGFSGGGSGGGGGGAGGGF